MNTDICKTGLPRRTNTSDGIGVIASQGHGTDLKADGLRVGRAHRLEQLCKGVSLSVLKRHKHVYIVRLVGSGVRHHGAVARIRRPGPAQRWPPPQVEIDLHHFWNYWNWNWNVCYLETRYSDNFYNHFCARVSSFSSRQVINVQTLIIRPYKEYSSLFGLAQSMLSTPTLDSLDSAAARDSIINLQFNL